MLICALFLHILVVSSYLTNDEWHTTWELVSLTVYLDAFISVQASQPVAAHITLKSLMLTTK